jgi:aryl-alcohol dehydrogenase-like predicted oxidoreductase
MIDPTPNTMMGDGDDHEGLFPARAVADPRSSADQAAGRIRAMKYRDFGRTGWKVSEVSFGAWAIGGAWGDVDDETSLAALNAALDSGVNFIDTADVYGDGRSERLIAKLRQQRAGETIHVATKAGRRLSPHTADGYNRENLTDFVERSLKNLQVDSLELVQLHCPPTDVYYRPEVFQVMDDLVKQGKIQFYGVSVEKVEEALKAIEFPNVQSVQIIFNMFRLRPAELFFQEAKRRRIGILARVPLASGLLSGKMTRQTQFARDDHRNFNRHGEEFDVGETFSGVDYKTGLTAVEELKRLIPPGATMAQLALRWILMFDAISCVIPGAKNPQQAQQNAAAADLPALSAEQMQQVQTVYNKYIRAQVRQRW